MTYTEAVEFLQSRIRFGIRPGTERVAALVDVLDHPERTYPVLHIAGTNGKYSVARICTAILSELGMSVGTYTSPDLGNLRERIGFGRELEPISEDVFASTVEYLRPFIDLIERDRDDELTYFELLTAIAFESYFDHAVHAAVLEAGLGGEYDATNVADGRVAVITNVTLDHVRQFGGDLAKAAWEKSGIAKRDGIVVTGVEQDDLFRIVEDRANERGASKILRLGRDIDLLRRGVAVGGQVVGIRGMHGDYEDLFLSLFGKQQATNAVLAVTACEAFVGEQLDQEILQQALGDVRVPARVEVLQRKPLVVCDGGHNPAAAEVVKDTVLEAFAFDKLILVVGMLSEKLIDESLAFWASVADRFVVTAPSGTERAADPEVLEESLRVAGVGPERIELVAGVPQAIEHAISGATPEDLVMVFGSFYTASEARDWAHAKGE